MSLFLVTIFENYAKDTEIIENQQSGIIRKVKGQGQKGLKASKSAPITQGSKTTNSI